MTSDTLDTDATARASREALDRAKAQRDDLQARLTEAQATAEREHAARLRVAFAASQDNPKAKAALAKHTAAERAAEDDAENLTAALAEAETRLAAAEQAEKDADRNHRLSQAGRILDDELLPLAQRIDGAAANFAGLVAERETVLNRLAALDVITSLQRIGARFDGKRFAAVFAHSLAAELPSIASWFNRLAPFGRTMMDDDSALGRSFRPPPADATAVPPKEDGAEAAAETPEGEDHEEAGIDFNPATGARIIRPAGEEAPSHSPSGARIIRR